MAPTTKQRLSDMLDADLSKAEVQDIAEEQGSSKPSTFSDWIQAASMDDMKACLKSLLTVGNGQALEQMKIVLEEDRAHQDWVQNQEKVWKESADTDAPMQASKSPKEEAEPLGEERAVQHQVRFIPLRLTAEERSLLGILEGALYVSEYTDQVDVYHSGSKARRMALQIQQACAILAGLVVANNFDVARRPLMERSFAENHYFFRMVFEIGRRYKILNPDKLRGSYGKLIHLLQDSVKGEVARQLDFDCVGPVKTVWSLVKGNAKALAMLQDPLLTIATKEIYTEGKSRAEVSQESKDKAEALVELKRKYSEKPPEGVPPPKAAGDLGEALRGGSKRPELEGLLTEERIETVVASISDFFAFLRFNREPVERMIEYLKAYFSPSKEGDWSLEISRGRGGSCLSHSHRTQYTFVLQSLLLWREIMGRMFELWQMTEEDLLDASSTYRLCDTGQGLNRVQSAPRVSRVMHQILHKVQNEVGNWVGLSVVHLGDRDVPNALVFIDKYTQVPRILGPLVQTLDKLPEVYNSSHAIKTYIDTEFRGVEVVRMAIMQDFFRHGFDGSGDDGGSCVDGRLTSCWNWCSKIEKKKYFPCFLLTGFTGFDGGFSTGLGS
mmetsp:Transcript_77621/g.186185  ORF Transcript_77621/g.186185 Transcript_77621/m.186185 type:complete len:611 (+) Transcript_77621:43-1875(+)|eukprot:CAMPEP_0181436868 /NCGR_PEP_ID=MMETSP1110-20121109/21075_1 /TAXON_ID=174948 /ORGANISM="Symbiodinium sp., Strain CCMP421" /LENGTH=610 /DNA_ID=CAMNT_0023560457 /DNA_START=40 /DNA_END=1872 /DNA_ORIENTATION=-